MNVNMFIADGEAYFLEYDNQTITCTNFVFVKSTYKCTYRYICAIKQLQEVAKCLSYHQLCSSTLQMAATKSLHTILFEESIIQLLNYKQPSMDVIIAGNLNSTYLHTYVPTCTCATFDGNA